MAGYSGTPLAKKLGIKEGHRVAFPSAPDGFRDLLGELPDDVSIKPRATGPVDVIVFFTRRRAELERRLPALRRAMDPAAGLWIAWPKRASGVETDMTEDVARELGLTNRLVDNKVAAIDETWSGLRLVIRLEDRPGQAKRART
ncbi:MAG TPA: DUF3052 domain-containing protein [Solirubrobacterales bacterium]|nr:DUF3052 domain-containing protein [Solirubrobacterales bacterium]